MTVIWKLWDARLGFQATIKIAKLRFLWAIKIPDDLRNGKGGRIKTD